MNNNENLSDQLTADEISVSRQIVVQRKIKPLVPQEREIALNLPAAM